MQMLVQLRWQDDRLAYKNMSEMAELVGQNYLVRKLWVPNVFMSDNKISVTRFTLKDQVVSIMPHGEVILSNRYAHMLTFCFYFLHLLIICSFLIKLIISANPFCSLQTPPPLVWAYCANP